MEHESFLSRGDALAAISPTGLAAFTGKLVSKQRRHSLAVGSIAVGFIVFGGCKRSHDSSAMVHPAASTNTVLQQRLAERDAGVWRDEVSAREHEKIFVQLADNLRRGEDKAAVLAQFPFEWILIPRRDGDPISLDAGVRLQRFAVTNHMGLSHAAWLKGATQFREAGWALAQIEWQHEKFTPATNGRPALSGFAFELHGEQGRANESVHRSRLFASRVGLNSRTRRPVCWQKDGGAHWQHRRLIWMAMATWTSSR